jgi:transcriptional regulator GlxA family with amidase domain
VPGGYGTREQQENPVALDWIRRQRQGNALTTSVCTGAFLLGAAGLLDGKRATTHWATIDGLRHAYPGIEVLDDVRIVDEGEIVTSAGISAGIDMALHVVRRLHGDEVARLTARDMEYEWGMG